MLKYLNKFRHRGTALNLISAKIYLHLAVDATIPTTNLMFTIFVNSKHARLALQASYHKKQCQVVVD